MGVVNKSSGILRFLLNVVRRLLIKSVEPRTWNYLKLEK